MLDRQADVVYSIDFMIISCYLNLLLTHWHFPIKNKAFLVIYNIYC